MQNIQNTLLTETVQLEEILSRLSWVSKRYISCQLNQFQITPPQFATLRCIAQKQNGVSMSDLSDHCQAVMPTMTGIIKRLVSRGLVERKPDPSDRRTTLILLTETGQQLLSEITQLRREYLDQYLLTLTLQERQSTIEILERYLQNMETWLLNQEAA
ncbi:MAG: hypothetical protein CL609_17270 [Anaerolineaceae bacterium]|nr:hypothetical protein [Anaerolineaceae bacterium]